MPVKAWKALTIPKRFKLPYNLKLTKNENTLPESLQSRVNELSEKVQRNPYAFLTRLTVGVDKSTNLTWAVPTIGERHEHGLGQGRYVAQNQLALHSFEKTARYKYTFRNKAIYRSDMTNLIKSKLSDIALANTKANLERSSSMTTLRFDNGHWIVQDHVQADSISFALLFNQSLRADTKEGTRRSFQNITDGRSLTTIPFYDVEALWSKTIADSLKESLDNVNNDNEAPVAIAFTLDQKVSRNAIALWKLAGFFRTTETLNS
ncbi:hypothetical protein INT44_008985 [Umbelopsis vinacea]|uniref:Uncharacterized protein n=1 Tax=Umbelopsis vinacea TaxID=44442 RepID=A0A8H7Q090_9FUNG|nr:hypothetical protein INT44_008985 [Umbelopsis vinacea]